MATEQTNVLSIQSKICTIRSQQVMLDFDLAKLYGVETRVLKQAVKRNINRFPADFMFVLTSEELENLRSQFATSSWGGTRYPPFAFTEQGMTRLTARLCAVTASADRSFPCRTGVRRSRAWHSQPPQFSHHSHKSKKG